MVAKPSVARFIADFAGISALVTAQSVDLQSWDCRVLHTLTNKLHISPDQNEKCIEAFRVLSSGNTIPKTRGLLIGSVLGRLRSTSLVRAGGLITKVFRMAGLRCGFGRVRVRVLRGEPDCESQRVRSDASL
jgi:hypothetical protein